MRQQQFRNTQFPAKALSRKKALVWLVTHPEADRAAFWLDQSEKHRKLTARLMIVVFVSMSISLIMQIAVFVLRGLGL